MDKILTARFFQLESGRIPVLEFIKGFEQSDRKIIGADILRLELFWPVGMPTCRPLGNGLFEIRSNISSNRITRLLFMVRDGELWLLHAIIKKTTTLPRADMDLALSRAKLI